MISAADPAPGRTLLRAGCVLLGLAVLLALAVAVLVFGPGRTLAHRGVIGTTLVVDVPADRDWAVYTTSSTWRANGCEVSDAHGREIVLRPDMLQQNLPGWPTWYLQGSFELDRGQQLTVSCVGPPGQFAVGPSTGIIYLLLVFVHGLLAALLAMAGLTLIVVAAVRGTGDLRFTPAGSDRAASRGRTGSSTGHGSRPATVVRPRCW